MNRPGPAHQAIGVPSRRRAARPGKIRPMILLWALGVPIPIILILLLMRGCFG